MLAFALKRLSKKKFDKTPLPVLPYEIWMHIASFISNDDLSKLIQVHRAFFDLIMQTTYREVLVYHEREDSTNRCLRVMGPVAASYVRKLTLRPHLFGSYMRAKVGSSASKSGRPDSRIHLHGGSSNIRILLRNIFAMTRLTSLVVGCYSTDSWQRFIEALPFLDTAWSHSPRLQNLSLHLPVECLDKVLTTTPHFHVLEELSLTIWTHSPDSPFCKSALMTVASFINRHASSLTHLTIDIHTSDLDPFPLFSGIGHLPKLIGASLHRLHPQEECPYNGFLIKHKITLEQLRFQFYQPVLSTRPTPTSFFSIPIFQADFPSIRFLDLGLCYWDKESEASLAKGMARYLSKFRHTITRLIIRDCILSLPTIKAFVSVLSEDVVLRELEMHVHYLSSDLLDLLASKLPRLHSLDLTYSWLQYKDDGRWDPDLNRMTSITTRTIQECLENFCHNDYSLWSLRHLRVCPRTLDARCGDVRKIMAACLPNVSTINGFPRSNFEHSHLMITTPLFFSPVTIR